MPKIFISYSRDDSAIAVPLYGALRDVGFEVFLDKYEILIGENLVSRISSAISEAGYVIALISESSVNSSWCKTELNQAISWSITNQKVKVLPIRIGEVTMPNSLVGEAYYEYGNNSANDFHNKIIVDIYKYEERNSGHTPNSQQLEEIDDFELNGSEINQVESETQVTATVTASAQVHSQREIDDGNRDESKSKLEDLANRMDLTEEAGIFLSLVPARKGDFPITRANGAILRQEVERKRVIPTSGYLYWENFSVGLNRFEIDGGRSNNGLLMCAADLYTDGSGVFGFTMRPADLSNNGSVFVFNDEVVVAAIIGGLRLLGEHSVDRSHSFGKFSIDFKLVNSEDAISTQPGQSRSLFGNKVLQGSRAITVTQDVHAEVNTEDVNNPSPKMMIVVFKLVNQLLNQYGVIETEQVNQYGEIVIQHWSGEWAKTLESWAPDYGIVLTDYSGRS
jgi:hypothetical protein